MTRFALSKVQRDAMRHMLLAGIRPRDVARVLPVSSATRVALRPRKRSHQVRP